MALEQFEEFNSKVNENYYYNNQTVDMVKKYITWSTAKNQYDIAIKKGTSLVNENALNNPAPGLDELISFCESELEKQQEQTLDRVR